MENSGPDILLLERVWGDGPLDEAVSFRRRPLGVVVYDAAQDEYRHRSVQNALAAVPIDSGVIPPGGGLELFLAIKSLSVGPRPVRLRARGHLIPPGELTERVYLAPATIQGAVIRYHRLAEPESLGTGSHIVQVAGCRGAELESQLDLEVTSDVDDPAAAALERAGPGSELVDRVRRLGNAWVLSTPDGTTHLVRGERHLRCPPGTIARSFLRTLDEEPFFQPLLLTFQSDRARALRDSGRLPLKGLERGQQLLPAEAAWDLLEAALGAGLSVAWERQTAVGGGPVVR